MESSSVIFGLPSRAGFLWGQPHFVLCCDGWGQRVTQILSSSSFLLSSFFFLPQPPSCFWHFTQATGSQAPSAIPSATHPQPLSHSHPWQVSFLPLQSLQLIILVHCWQVSFLGHHRAKLSLPFCRYLRIPCFLVGRVLLISFSASRSSGLWAFAAVHA